MKAVLKLLWVVLIAGLGWLVYPLCANILVAAGFLSGDDVGTSFGVEMTHKAVMIWLICVPLSVWATFMQSRWRLILLFAPLYAPSVFAVIYTLLNRGEAPPVAP